MWMMASIRNSALAIGRTAGKGGSLLSDEFFKVNFDL